MNVLSGNGRAEIGAPKVVDVEALGQSEAFLAFTDRLSRVAPVNRPVLLIGERGTGKELAAARLHYLSGRWQAPLATLNCAALTPSLIEAELFGFEKGAFTGAEQRRPGRFEAAHSGTLFLDEIGNIPLEVQAKILRAVEYGLFERVGGTRSVEVDVRIIGATNSDLGAMAADGRFKPDLLDRLAFEVLIVPPLRLRSGDIALLTDHFAMKMAVELNLPDMPRFSRSARKQLETYHWPGNIRELKNVVERSVYRSSPEPIDEIELNPFASLSEPTTEFASAFKASRQLVHDDALPGADDNSLTEAVNSIEIRMLKKALKLTRYNQRKAARQLGITYDRLRGLMRRHAEHLD